MKTLVLGAGAVGGYFGARLIESGADVTFLVRPARAQRLKADGLLVKSPVGDARLQVQILAPDDPGRPFDLILLACKAYDLDPAIEAIRAHMAAGAGLVLPLLNGMAHIDLLRDRFGHDRVLGGTCGIFATLGPVGEILHLEKVARLSFGRFRDQVERGVLAGEADGAEALFARARFTSMRQEPIEQGLWDKWVMLAPMAAGTVLMRGAVGEILKARDGESVLLDLQAELIAIASAAGYPPSNAQIELARSFLIKPGSPAKASLLRDVERGGQTEGVHVIGDLLRRAEGFGLATPLLRLANAHLETYEAARGAEG
jgi:2-dehydropantoate 2-reductase